jgi:hypothetical protein
MPSSPVGLLPYSEPDKSTPRRSILVTNRVDLGHNVMKGTEYFVPLKTGVVITENYNATVNGEKLIGTTEYVTL